MHAAVSGGQVRGRMVSSPHFRRAGAGSEESHAGHVAGLSVLRPSGGGRSRGLLHSAERVQRRADMAEGTHGRPHPGKTACLSRAEARLRGKPEQDVGVPCGASGRAQERAALYYERRAKRCVSAACGKSCRAGCAALQRIAQSVEQDGRLQRTFRRHRAQGGMT